MNDDINKTQTDQDSIVQTVDAEGADDQAGYHVHDLDDKGTSDKDLEATDPDHFADDVIGNKKDMSFEYDDSGDPDDVVNTDLGGLYPRDESFDEDGVSREAGTPGLIGGDDDTD